VIGNRFPESIKSQLETLVQQLQDEGFNNITLAGFIPEDDAIAEFNFAGRSLLELPEDNPAYVAFKELAESFSFL
jgi:CO dehydrogenase nickel-insertion accessory protein CooC1